MPWCDGCDRYLTPTSLGPGGICPTCAKPIDRGSQRVPWHFKLFVVATVFYLGFRAYQGVDWVWRHAGVGAAVATVAGTAVIGSALVLWFRRSRGEDAA